jgi:hypothetical protein
LPGPSARPDPKSTRTVSLMVAICHRMKEYRHITTSMRFAEGLLKRSALLTSRGEARPETALLLELRSRLVVARIFASQPGKARRHVRMAAPLAHDEASMYRGQSRPESGLVPLGAQREY